MKLSMQTIVKHFIVIVMIFFSAFSIAQSKLPANALKITGGYSKHGSGDFKGIVFGTEYVDYLTRKISLNYNFRATLNDGKETIIVNNSTTGTRTDASVRFTTAGVQVGINGGLSIIRNSKSELLISLGAFGRYQSASNGADGYSLYYPSLTGQPTVLIGYDNQTPQRTFAVGGIFQFEYNYTLKDKIYIGLTPAFQTDSNGDAIMQVALSVGRRF